MIINIENKDTILTGGKVGEKIVFIQMNIIAPTIIGLASYDGNNNNEALIAIILGLKNYKSMFLSKFLILIF